MILVFICCYFTSKITYSAYVCVGQLHVVVGGQFLRAQSPVPVSPWVNFRSACTASAPAAAELLRSCFLFVQDMFL